MTLLITGIIVWLIAIAFILRFFAVCKEIKRKPKPAPDSRNPHIHIGKDTDTERLALLFFATLHKINEIAGKQPVSSDELYWEIDKAKDELTHVLEENRKRNQ